MNSTSPPNREALAELLLRWEELYESGQDAPASELAKDHPELIPELARRIKALKSLSWITTRLVEPPSSEHGTPSIGLTGKTLGGRYRLDELVAEGGFAEVYRAYDTELQRVVAVKVPKPGRLHSSEAFLAEARRVAGLKHDGIVPVHDVGVEGDTCFIVSEFLEGGSLADRLSKGRPATQEAIRWITEIAHALGYAHSQGVVHRDVKPANILIDQHGHAKLADFGIAQSSSDTPGLSASIGTLRFMSPEQLMGPTVDHRTDIYSLSVILHEVLTGRSPYRCDDSCSLRTAILSAKIAVCNELPGALRHVIRQSLQKDRDLRHSSVDAWADAVQKACQERPSSRPLFLGAVTGAVVLLGGLAWSGLSRTHVTPSAPMVSSDKKAPQRGYDPSKAHADQQAWAERLGIQTRTVNTIGMALVVIPPGRLTMGQGTDAVTIALDIPFLMGETEVTQGQWSEVMGSQPWTGQQYTTEGLDIPATWVSWEDAVSFCEKLTALERMSGAIGSEQEYRLPSEAEWEFACRADTDTKYWFGDDHALLGDHAWFGGGWNPATGLVPGGNTRDEPYPHKTKSKKPNPYGLYDTYGNVWEWVNDRYDKDAEVKLLYRGGGWVNTAEVCSSRTRGWTQPWGRHCYLGFRVVLSTARPSHPPAPEGT